MDYPGTGLSVPGNVSAIICSLVYASSFVDENLRGGAASQIEHVPRDEEISGSARIRGRLSRFYPHFTNTSRKTEGLILIRCDPMDTHPNDV